MIKIGEGETAEVFRLDDDKVLKLFKEEFYDPEDFELEYHTAKYMGDTTNIAPTVFGKITVDNRYGYTMDEVKGLLLQKEIERNPQAIKAYGTKLGQVHRSLHEKAITDDLHDLNACNDFLMSFLIRNTTLPTEVNSWLGELLNSLPSKPSLLHGDFMPYNIMIQSNELQVLDWAEPSIGSAVLDVARTINFIFDPTDYPESIVTKESSSFISAYLKGYYGDSPIAKDELHSAFLVNAAAELAWAERSGQSDFYSEYLKSLIIRNYESDENVYVEAFEQL